MAAKRSGLTQALGTTVNGLRASRTLLITLCVYVVLCIPAIFVAEHFGLRQGPLHASQLLAVLACVPSALAYLWLSRGNPLHGLRLVAVAAVTLALLWLAFLAYFVMTADFGTD